MKLEGLKQQFCNENGVCHTLEDVIDSSDWWELKKRGSKTVILTHQGIQKIADLAGVSKVVEYRILISPDYTNNYQLSMEAKVCRGQECVNEIGEVNRSNLTGTGRNNPTNMAQKRAYDRAVLRLLGIQGMLSEEELTTNEDDKKMDALTIDQQLKIKDDINAVIAAATLPDLQLVGKQIKSKIATYTADERQYLLDFWYKKKTVLEFQASKQPF